MSVKPIGPDEVRKLNPIPDEVIEAFNFLIAQHLTENCAVILQVDVEKRAAAHGIKRDDLFINHWLDVEDLYRAEGWEVEYDKPAYNETYEPTFMFCRKPKSLDKR